MPLKLLRRRSPPQLQTQRPENLQPILLRSPHRPVSSPRNGQMPLPISRVALPSTRPRRVLREPLAVRHLLKMAPRPRLPTHQAANPGQNRQPGPFVSHPLRLRQLQPPPVDWVAQAPQTDEPPLPLLPLSHESRRLSRVQLMHPRRAELPLRVFADSRLDHPLPHNPRRNAQALGLVITAQSLLMRASSQE